jgi:hypothetical protein
VGARHDQTRVAGREALGQALGDARGAAVEEVAGTSLPAAVDEQRQEVRPADAADVAAHRPADPHERHAVGCRDGIGLVEGLAKHRVVGRLDERVGRAEMGPQPGP